MATKGTNAKIKELKGIKPDKISAEDLGKLQTAVSKINQTYIELGRLSASQHSSLHSLAGLQDEMMVLQNDVEKTYDLFMKQDPRVIDKVYVNIQALSNCYLYMPSLATQDSRFFKDSVRNL